MLSALQYGSYFGHAVAAVDLDGDSYDDLVVGAPLFSDTWYEQGAVYVYMNKMVCQSLLQVSCMQLF
jgi:hypothetical protein